MNKVINLHNYNISPRVDALMQKLENGGLALSVINQKHHNRLVAEIWETVATPDAWQAFQELNAIFLSDEELREKIFYYAFAVGAVYQELKSVVKH